MYPFIIVDDEPIMLKGLRYLLEKPGLPVSSIREASNGRETLSLVEPGITQIIITDIQMPDMDGLAFCREMHLSHSGNPMIIISGHESFAYAKEALQYGVKDYLLKPLDKEAFLTTVRRVVDELEEEAAMSFVPDFELVQLAQSFFDVLLLPANEAESVFARLFHLLKGLSLQAAMKAYQVLRDRLLALISGRHGLSADMFPVILQETGREAFWQEVQADIRQIRMAVLRGMSDKELQIVQAAKLYIQEHIHSEVSLEEIAALYGYNASYFSTLFKQKTGTSYLAYRTDLRMHKARELLQTSDKTIAEVAYEVGYTDAAGFMRTFKKYTGITPSEYRKGPEL